MQLDSTIPAVNRKIIDYFSLAKPRVILLHLFTAACTMFLATGGMLSTAIFGFTLLGGGLAAGAANALNCYFDRDIDALMSRTCRRPLPNGRLTSMNALVFASITGFVGLLVLGILVNLAAAILAAAAIAYYLLIYTLWLKRSTPWAPVIGSGAGAFTPLVAWAAVSERVEWAPFLLFLIITLWTLPHFWSLVIVRRDEYENAGVAVASNRTMGIWIISCVCGLTVVSALMAPLASLGAVYLVTSTALSMAFLFLAVRMVRSPGIQIARTIFLYSLVYMTFLTAAIIADKIYAAL